MYNENKLIARGNGCNFQHFRDLCISLKKNNQYFGNLVKKSNPFHLAYSRLVASCEGTVLLIALGDSDSAAVKIQMQVWCVAYVYVSFELKAAHRNTPKGGHVRFYFHYRRSLSAKPFK